MDRDKETKARDMYVRCIITQYTIPNTLIAMWLDTAFVNFRIDWA